MHDIFVLNLGSHDYNISRILKRYPHAQVTRFYNSVLSGVFRCAQKSKTKHFWLILSCADISQFDLDWDPVPWEAQQIHCWPTTNQKFGDVLLIPVKEFLDQKPQQLEYFEHVNYHSDEIPRVPWPVTVYGDRDLTKAILDADWISRFHLFTNTCCVLSGNLDEPALWGPKSYQLISYSKDNAVCIVPKNAREDLQTQVYDYAVLSKAPAVLPQTQDIVFISYDEPQADANYNLLSSRFPQAKRIHGVNGMELALREAAKASTTPWFYAVFAKTRLHEDWDFSFVPDRWQAPKHYIFNALNMSNELCYGHMGIILYHRDTVLNAPTWDDINGLDYTMSFDTESIPLTSVYGEFATDPYRAWRTAFRETAKLVQWHLDEKCVETAYRLHVWQTHAQGPYSEWVLRGARDGIDYYGKHLMDHGALKQMFRWDWLNEYFLKLYAQDQSLQQHDKLQHN